MAKIIFFGDFFLKAGSGVPIFSEEILKLVCKHDIACINLEGPIFCKDLKPAKKVGPHLCLDEKTPYFLEKTGFSLISIANNHSMDYGPKGLSQTISSFKDAKVAGGGKYEEVYCPVVFTKDNKRIGILAASERQFGAATSKKEYGYAWICHPNFQSFVEEAKKQCDVLFVFAHCGLEGIDIPLPQWRDNFKAIIDHGADAIISTHTHCAQGMETYKGKPIFYSLGNLFFSYDKKNDNANIGYCVSFEIKEDNSLSWERFGHKTRPERALELYECDFKSLDSKISSDKYNENIEKISIDFWEKVYKRYYQSSLVSLNNNIWHNIKLLIKNTMGMTKINPSLLLHNIMIESHRYTTEIALRKITTIQ